MRTRPVHPQLVAFVRGVAKGASGLVIVVSALVLAGWLLNAPSLKSVLPGLVAMNPITAVGFIIAGAGLAAAVMNPRASIARGCGLAIATGGALVLCRYFFGWDSGVDRLLFTASLQGNVMAPTTACAFVCAGLALLLFDLETRFGQRPGELLAIIVTVIALLALTGYAYEVEKLYRVGRFIAMALHTAGTFLVLSVGLLCARPDRGLMRRVVSDGAGGAMLRRLLAAIIGVPFALGWLMLKALQNGLVDEQLGLSFFVVSVVLFVVTMIVRNAGLLDEKESERDEFEAELRKAHGGLETTVQESTAELRHVIDALGDGVRVLGAAAEEILASTSQLAATATQSAASVTETSATVEEVRQTVQVASGEAQRVASTAQRTAEISRAGKSATEATLTGMRRIQVEMHSIAESMVRLSEQSHAIGEIITAVDEISDQSNLLAVNAAIEAATAGEHGKGFAVVAQEVKYLASQSQQATRQVRRILNDIQKATGAAVMTTEQASKAVEAGVRDSAGAGESIVTLADQIGDAEQTAAQIAASSLQQLTGMDHVAVAMGQIKDAAVQNAEQAGQLQQSARNLNALGHRLKELVERHQARSSP